MQTSAQMQKGAVNRKKSIFPPTQFQIEERYRSKHPKTDAQDQSYTQNTGNHTLSTTQKTAKLYKERSMDVMRDSRESVVQRRQGQHLIHNIMLPLWQT